MPRTVGSPVPRCPGPGHAEGERAAIRCGSQAAGGSAAAPGGKGDGAPRERRSFACRSSLSRPVCLSADPPVVTYGQECRQTSTTRCDALSIRVVRSSSPASCRLEGHIACRSKDERRHRGRHGYSLAYGNRLSNRGYPSTERGIRTPVQGSKGAARRPARSNTDRRAYRAGQRPPRPGELLSAERLQSSDHGLGRRHAGAELGARERRSRLPADDPGLYDEFGEAAPPGPGPRGHGCESR
jgi:hypothetical protein